MMKSLSLFIIMGILFFGFSSNSYAEKKLIKLIPNPREIEFTGNDAVLNQNWEIVVDEMDGDDAYAASLVQKEADACFSFDFDITEDAPSSNYIVFRNYEPEGDEPELFLEQGYNLTVESDNIVIEAPSATGRFYGAQTLRQIFRNSHKNKIPGLEIMDFPSLKWRGISDDISRGQVSRVDDFKNIIRELAFYKKNIYQPYIEDMFRFEADPEIGRERGAITKKEMAIMKEEAKKNHILLAPVFESLGHQDRLLSLPQNRKYAEVQEPGERVWSFSPVNENAFEFVTTLIDELAEATDSPFFHIGGDESFDVGKGTSKERVEEVGVGRVHAEYFSKLHDHIKKEHDRRMMLYADMINRHPDAMEYMPKDAIMIDWHYSPKSDFETAGELKDSGFSVMTSPGLWSWANYYPCYYYAFPNIKTAASVAKEKNLMGCITSSWGDNGAENLRENNWLGYAYSASVEWEPDESEADSFLRRFVAVHFGDDSQELAEAMKYPGWYDYLDVHYLARSFHRTVKIKPMKEDWLDGMERLKSEMVSLLEVLDKHEAQFRFHKDYVNILRHVAKRNIYLADRDIAMNRIAGLLGNRKSGEIFDAVQQDIRNDIAELRDRLAEMTGEYEKLWLQRYKFPRLDFNLERLNDQAAKLQSFVTRGVAGELAAQKPPQGVWFWYPDADPQKQTSEGTRYFIRNFNLEKIPMTAGLECWADDRAEVYLNGEKLFTVSYYDNPKTKTISSLLKEGENRLAIEAENTVGAAGILLELRLVYDRRNTGLITGDDKWLTTENPGDDWKTGDVDTTDWKEVKTLGKGLIEPWKFIDW